MDVTPLHDDLLIGADAIASETGFTARQVYYLGSKKDGGLPIFRLGSILCARKSELAEALSAKTR